MTNISSKEPVILQISETKRTAAINNYDGKINLSDIAAFFSMIDALPVSFQPVIHELVIKESVPEDVRIYAITMASKREIPVYLESFGVLVLISGKAFSEKAA